MSEWIGGAIFLIFATIFIGAFFPDKLGWWFGLLLFVLLGAFLDKVFR